MFLHPAVKRKKNTSFLFKHKNKAPRVWQVTLLLLKGLYYTNKPKCNLSKIQHPETDTAIIHIKQTKIWFMSTLLQRQAHSRKCASASVVQLILNVYIQAFLPTSLFLACFKSLLFCVWSCRNLDRKRFCYIVI